MNLLSIKTWMTGLTIFACLLLAMPALAQNNPGQRGGRGQRGQRMLQRMASELNLSQEQTSQLRTIFQSRKTQMQQLKQQMNTLITPEQRDALKELRQSGADRQTMRARMSELGITRDQLRQMKTLKQQMKASRESIQSEISSILTPEQQQRFEELRQKRKNRRGQQGQSRRGQRNRF